MLSVGCFPLTAVSKALAVLVLKRKTTKQDQSARFSRPATIERILQEFSVPSAVASLECSISSTREEGIVPKKLVLTAYRLSVSQVGRYCLGILVVM